MTPEYKFVFDNPDDAGKRLHKCCRGVLCILAFLLFGVLFEQIENIYGFENSKPLLTNLFASPPYIMAGRRPPGYPTPGEDLAERHRHEKFVARWAPWGCLCFFGILLTFFAMLLMYFMM